MNAAAKYDPAAQRRRSMLAKVHLAKKELGLDEDTYRAILKRLTGEASAADCGEAQLGAVLDEFKVKGWKPAVGGGAGRSSGRAPRAKPADHPSARKARALWISLHQLGVIHNASEEALEAFARRQLRVEKMQWADQARIYRLIEALKAMAEREGWSQHLDVRDRPRQVRVLKERLFRAQERKLIGDRANGAGPILVDDDYLDELIAENARHIWSMDFG